jgi:hypothetical protein
LMVCIYCGRPCEWRCRDCGEAHLVTEDEFDEYHDDEPNVRGNRETTHDKA